MITVEAKREALAANGWQTYWTEDNWIKSSWIGSSMNLDWAGSSTDMAYDRMMLEVFKVDNRPPDEFSRWKAFMNEPTDHQPVGR